MGQQRVKLTGSSYLQRSQRANQRFLGWAHTQMTVHKSNQLLGLGKVQKNFKEQPNFLDFNYKSGPLFNDAPFIRIFHREMGLTGLGQWVRMKIIIFAK